MPVDTKKGWCSNCRMGQHHACVRDLHGGLCECRAHKPSPVEAAKPERAKPVEQARPAAPVNGSTPAPKALIAWEDPPPKRSGPTVINIEAERELRANPGRWARLKDYGNKTGASTAAASIRKGRRGIAAGDFEAEARVTATGSTLYVRFVGRGGASA